MRRSHMILSSVLLLLVVGTAFGQNAPQRDQLMRQNQQAQAEIDAMRAQQAALLAQLAADKAQLQRAQAQVAQVEVQVRPAGPRVIEEPVQDAAEAPAEGDADAATQPEPDTQPEPAEDVAPGTMRFYLMDGSVLTGTLAVDTIPMKTEFGNLVVPIESIQRFAPGLQSHPELEKRISTLVEQLGHPDAGRRDAAQSQLVAFGPGLINELTTHKGSDDAERKLRVEAILETLYEMSMDPMSAMGPETQARPSLVRLDEIETEAFTMAGQITQTEFEIRSKFGTLKVSLGDIMSVEVLTSTVPETRRSIEISGSDFAGISYKNTGIRLNRGDRVIIQADGQITMSPWGRNTMSGPDGMPQNGQYSGNIPLGALCGKIGDSGEEMMIGSKTNFVAQRAGTLYLGFAMQSNWTNQNFPGKYDVRIRVIPAGQ